MPPASAMVIGMASASNALDRRVSTMMGVCSEVNSLVHTCRFKTDMESRKQFTRLNWPRTRARGERKWYTGRSVHVECFGESGPKSGEASTSGRSQELDVDGLKSSVLLLEEVDVEDAGRTSSSGDEARSGMELSPPLPSKLSSQVGTWLLHLVAVGYAAAAVAQKGLEGGADPSGPVPPTSLHFFLRFTMAAAAVGVPLILRNVFRSQNKPPSSSSSPPGNNTTVAHGIELGVWMFLTYAGQAIGLESSSADHATLLLTLSVRLTTALRMFVDFVKGCEEVVLVPFLEALGGRAISRNVWTATALASVGIVLLEGGSVSLGGGGGAGGSFLNLPPGHLWCLGGAICSAIHVVRAEALCAESEPLTLTAVQLATVGVLAVPWVALDVARAGPTLGNFPGALESIPWGLLLLAGPVGTGLCEWLELEALRFASASTATLILTAGPLWTTVFAFMFLGEGLDKSSIAGAALLLLAVLQVQVPAGKSDGDGSGDPIKRRRKMELDSHGDVIEVVGEECRPQDRNGNSRAHHMRKHSNSFGMVRHAKRRAMSLVWAKMRGCTDKKGE